MKNRVFKIVAFLILLICAISYFTYKKEVKFNKMTKIEIDESTFNFGEINASDTVRHEFLVKNITSTLLVISDVLPSCACTKATIDKTKLKQNEIAKISVTYVPKVSQMGLVSSVVYLQCNAEKGIVKLNLKGRINNEIK